MKQTTPLLHLVFWTTWAGVPLISRFAAWTVGQTWTELDTYVFVFLGAVAAVVATTALANSFDEAYGRRGEG